MVNTPNPATHHSMAGRRGVQRTMCQQNRHSCCAHAGSAAQQAEAPRAGVQNFSRINRQKRYRAAEKNGEQIERNRAENDFLLPDVTETGENCFQADGLAGARFLAGLMRS